MKTTVCVWCLSLVKIKDSFNERKQKAVCSTGCRDAETLFEMMFSDEEINRREHYTKLTEGDNGKT